MTGKTVMAALETGGYIQETDNAFFNDRFR